MKQKRILGILLVFTLVLVSVFGNMSAGASAETKLQLNKSKVSMKVGSKIQLKVKKLPKNAKVTWTTSNKKRATVSKKGVVKAKKVGTVTIQSKIRYKTGGKKRTAKLTCKVTISKKSGLGKTLVVYFSVPEMKSNSNTKVDAVSSASIMVSGNKNRGNIQYVASVIQGNTGADTFRIQPQKAYPTNHSTLVNQAEKEQEQDVRPAIKNKLKNLNQYDTVFIGYPIWWGIAAWPVDTFIKANDFTGKTVIPFCTSSSSGLGESGELLEEMAGTGNWLEGERFSSGVSEEDVKAWIEGLGL